MITITHTHSTGTVVTGTTRGDGTAAILKPHRLRWSRTLDAWYLPHSRDNQPHTGTLHRLRDALAAAGHDTELDIDTTPRTTAEIEADRLTRATNRATALDNKATRHEHAADAAHARHAHDLDRLPPAGEPIKGSAVGTGDIKSG